MKATNRIRIVRFGTRFRVERCYLTWPLRKERWSTFGRNDWDTGWEALEFSSIESAERAYRECYDRNEESKRDAAWIPVKEVEL